MMATQGIARPPSAVLSAHLRADDPESSSQGHGEISMSRHAPSTSHFGVRHHIHDDPESQNGKEVRAVWDLHIKLPAQGLINLLGGGFGKPSSSHPELPISSNSTIGSRLSRLHSSRETTTTLESTTTETRATTSITSPEGPRRRQVEQHHAVSSSASGSDQPAQAAVDLSDEETIKLIPAGALTRDKIIHVLGPMFNAAPCILLFDGKPGAGELGQVVIVPVKDSLGDSVGLFREVHSAWHARFGRYRRLLSNFYGVKKVDMVKIQVLGSSVQPRREQDLSGICEPVDRVVEIQAAIHHVQAEINSFEKEFRSNPEVLADHDKFCPDWDLVSEEYMHYCEFTTWEGNKRRLKKLKEELTKAIIVPHAFVNPSLAFPHGGLLYSFIYSERDINKLTKPNPFTQTMDVGLDELHFNGLRIEMGWMAKPLKARALPIVTTVFLSIFIGARFIFGDWATAWTAVGSLAAVAAVMLTWITSELHR
ncbi:hypothetical protein B0H66DRAFT_546195 [Apodospora peruviana]|uniref:Uncharacterized protein n=1 Tax=Apodospora peruviana TaxID=516989 RepID=A0AAE0MG29_9PEZI|nr:hypothetical protein B0H66DRAFT_546195 [Apodospora peruviana]